MILYRPFNETCEVVHKHAGTPPAQFTRAICRSRQLMKIYIQVLRKALTIDCLARANDSTRAIGSARLIYSLKGLLILEKGHALMKVMKPLLTYLQGHLQSRGKTGHHVEYGKCTLEIFCLK